MSLQNLVDAMSEQWQEDRAKTQMTLGEFIVQLKSMPSDKMITGFSAPQSYRGYYRDLAFEPEPKKITVSAALDMCIGAMGEEFTGYKGGEYGMGRNTPIWIARYSYSGVRIMDIDKDSGELITAAEDE